MMISAKRVGEGEAGKGHRVMVCVKVEVKFKIVSPERASLSRW